MSRTLTISESLYAQLEADARSCGFSSVEEWLEQRQIDDAELRRRREVVAEINALRAQLFAAHGEMPDSVDLIREDRAR